MDHDTNEGGQVRRKSRKKIDDSTDPSRRRTDDNDIARNLLRIDRDAHVTRVPHSSMHQHWLRRDWKTLPTVNAAPPIGQLPSPVFSELATTDSPWAPVAPVAPVGPTESAFGGSAVHALAAVLADLGPSAELERHTLRSIGRATTRRLQRCDRGRSKAAPSTIAEASVRRLRNAARSDLGV